MMANQSFLDQLQSVIESRLSVSTEDSYIASLGGRSSDKALKKLGEEAIEAILAAKSDQPEELVNESADLLFHLMVVLAQRGIKIDQVIAELERRQGQSGLQEKLLRSAAKSG